VTAAVGRLVLPASAPSGEGRAGGVRTLASLTAVALLGLTGVALWPSRRQHPDLGDDTHPPTSRSPLRGRATPGSPASHAKPDRRPASDRGLLLGYGMVIAATLVVPPFTFYHQFLWLLIPFVLLAARGLECGRMLTPVALAALVLAADVSHFLWVFAQDATVASGVWRGFSFPFLLAVLTWELSRRALGEERCVTLDRIAPDPQDSSLLAPDESRGRSIQPGPDSERGTA